MICGMRQSVRLDKAVAQQREMVFISQPAWAMREQSKCHKRVC